MTLDEASALNKVDCATWGHDYVPVEVSLGHPVGLSCRRCDATWAISDATDVTVPPPMELAPFVSIPFQHYGERIEMMITEVISDGMTTRAYLEGQRRRGGRH